MHGYGKGLMRKGGGAERLCVGEEGKTEEEEEEDKDEENKARSNPFITHEPENTTDQKPPLSDLSPTPTPPTTKDFPLNPPPPRPPPEFKHPCLRGGLKHIA